MKTSIYSKLGHQADDVRIHSLSKYLCADDMCFLQENCIEIKEVLLETGQMIQTPCKSIICLDRGTKRDVVYLG